MSLGVFGDFITLALPTTAGAMRGDLYSLVLLLVRQVFVVMKWLTSSDVKLSGMSDN